MEKFKKVDNQCKLDGCRNPASANGYCFRHMSLAAPPKEEKPKKKKDDKE